MNQLEQESHENEMNSWLIKDIIKKAMTQKVIHGSKEKQKESHDKEIN